MEPNMLLDLLHAAGKLRDTPRHCVTPGGQKENVAEHSWRLALMAFWLRDEFPELDMERVVQMCLIHDLGEVFTGDIPVFQKTDADRRREARLLYAWVDAMPQPLREDMRSLYREMEAQETGEAKLYKALDGLEALISHNEAALSTWEPNEYTLQMTYAADRVAFSPYLTALREQIRQDSIRKIAAGSKEIPV